MTLKPQRPYRILVVDDDESLHGVFAFMLAPASDFPAQRRSANTETLVGEMDSANSPVFPTFAMDFAFQGQEALKLVQRSMAEDRPYTMAFIDMRMPPGWDGIETISQIWKECLDLQIVICTGHSDFSWHDLIKRFGHSDRLLIMKKPFDMTELRQVAYSLAEKWDLARQAQDNLDRLQKLVGERTAKLEEANLSLQRKIVENKQAERRLMAQYSVSLALAQATTLTSAIEIIFQIVCRSLNWVWGALWQIDPRSNVLRLANHWHAMELPLGDFFEASHKLSFEPGSGLPGTVWSSGQPAWIVDVATNPEFHRAAPAAKSDLHAAMAFPLISGGRILGVMEFISREVVEQDKEMLKTFAVIGSAIGQFIERKQAEENLKLERDYVNQIIRETPALVVGMSPDGTITFTNPSIARNTGYTAEELIGKNWWQLFYPGEQQKQVEQFFRDLEQGPVRDYEMVLTTKHGEQRTVSWNSLNKYNEAGHLAELIGFGNDITERKKAELERRSMETQLRHSQKLEAIGQLAAGIAHEINTPTQYIGDNIRFLQTSFADVNKLRAHFEKLVSAAQDGVVTPEFIAALDNPAEKENIEFLFKEIPEAIQQSLEGVDRVARIVRAMKDFSHPGTGEKTPINLNQAVETTLTVAGNEWKYVAAMKTDFASELPLVPCLPGELNQVILNLVVNAAHAIGDKYHGQGKGVITVSTRQFEEWAELRVTDDGTGIPEKIREKVFDPFFTTKPVGKGSGQGLAIAHAVIVDQHHGQLTFETELGKGTTFIARLPLATIGRARREKEIAA